jgi:hypothetical protein
MTNSQATEITFVLWDDATDGVAVKHNGEIVWEEQSFSSLDQYLRFYAPTGQPVTIIWEVVEDGQVTESAGAA